MTTTTEYVWESFHDPLQQFVRRHVRDASTAEDILQDVFLNIHTHLATLKDQDKLQHWLYQIARHAIIDHARRHKVTETLPDTFDPPEEPAEDDVERALLPSVIAMLACLPAAYREALLLTEYQGLTQKALAERLGLSLSGAKSRVQRAREKFKALLLACCHFEFDRWGKIIDYQPLYWLLRSSVQKQTLRDGERNPFLACKYRRVGVQSAIVNSILMLERGYSHLMEKLLLWVVF